MQRALLLTCLLLLRLAAAAQAPVFEVFEDTSRHMQAGAVHAAYQAGQFKPLSSAYLNPGFTKSIFWVALTQPPQTGEWYLVADNAHINHLEFYAVTDSIRLLHVTGDFHPFFQRPLVYNTFAFPLAPRAPLYLLKTDKHHESLQAPLLLRTREALQRQQVTETLVNGIFTGVIVLIILFGIFLYLTTRDAVYGWYALSVAAALMWIWSNKGLGFHYLWPDSVFFASRSRPLFVVLNLTFSLQFLTAYLGIKRTWPIRVAQAVWLLFAVLILWPVPYTNFVHLSMPIQQALPIFSLLVVCFMGWLLVKEVRQKNSAALIYMLATLVFIIFVVLENLYHLGRVQLPEFVAHYGMFLGVVLEMIIITFGLAARFNSYRKEKETALLQLARQQKELTDTIVTVEEKERKALADRLHDEIGAMLSLTSLQVNAGNTAQAGLLLKDISSTVRNISHQLTPVAMEKYGLRHAIEDMVQLANGSGKIHIELVIIGFSKEKEFPPNFLHTLYRIVQELLQNILKHAGAGNVLLQLVELEDSCTLLAEDNGKGMHLPPEGAGFLRSISAKVAYLEGAMNIDSSPGNGMLVNIELPLPVKPNT
ncbi:7TM diverse intracellular signaling domain-containing protein [Chitinophaga sp.]|uniref:sensor histidine kinase n=1 Tax=Chitinophaga sp. TaxID=1869181 RepID=UPI0031D0118C